MKKLSKEQWMTMLGWLATAMAMLMSISYTPQIIDNLNGHKGNFIQPLVAGINGTLWVVYALVKEKKDWPIAIANTPGVIFGFITFLTAL